MKKLYFLAIILFTICGYSQFNPNAPWNQESKISQKGKEQSFAQLVTSFNDYWENNNPNIKGSGYKPFKRWEYHWQNQLDSKGYIISPEETRSAFQQKMKAKSTIANRSSLSLPVSNWTSVGPFSNATTQNSAKTRARGRVNIIVGDPSNVNTLYFGTPAGGIWKSTNSGTSWIPLGDNLPQIGVSGIAVDYSNSNTIYIATGDKDANDTYSIGVLKSTDGGINWSPTGLTFSNTFSSAGDLLIHPTNNQILWCATSAGLFRTIDAGNTWSIIQTGDFSQGSIRLKPGTSSTIYATSQNAFYTSTDSGASFTQITSGGTGLPTTSSRMLIDVSPANPDYVYVMSAKTETGLGFQGIYKSTDSGVSFARNSTVNPVPTNIFQGTQSWYDLAFAVSPTNSNSLFSGCLNVWKSTDGGVLNTNWKALNSWSTYNAAFTHADIHFLGYINGKLYCGSDGGAYVSEDNGITFSDITGSAAITQFYKISVSKQSASKIAGGTQDNGGYAFNNNAWQGYHGGDGMDCAVNPTNSNQYFGFLYYGQNLYVSDNAGNSISNSVSAPVAESSGDNPADSGGNWVTPMAMNNAGELFSGFKKLYKLNQTSTTWNWVAQSLSTVGNGDIDEIAIDPSNDNNMYVSNRFELYKSTDKGVNFTLVYNASTNITSINVNFSNSNTIYITTAGSSGDVMKSIDGGLSFLSIKDGIPNIPKNVIRHQGRNSLNPLYVGTSLGVFYRDDSMSQFEPFDNNLPNVAVRDLEINIYDNVITAGTYGRGIWQSPIQYEAPANELKFVSIQNPTLNLNCNSSSITPEITVKNLGVNPVTSVNINYDYNGVPQDYIWTGNILSNNSQIINLPSISPSRGAYNLNVNSTISADTYLDNNQGSVPFYVNDAGVVGVINTFETPSSSLLTANEASSISLWKRGINTNGVLATTSSAYTTNFSGNYPDNVKSYIYSQCYNLSNAVNPQIKFDLAFDLEPNWDIVYVEYSTNMGATWTVLGTQGPNWYNSNRTNASSGAANDCQNCPGAQWTGTNTALTNYSYSLNTLVGQSNVIFRIVFHSDESANQLGVVVDNFGIDGTLGTDNFELKNIAIYPNPSAGIFNISTGNKAIDLVEVYDVTGKVIVTQKNFTQANSQSSLDLRNISDGIYFVKISSENQNTVKRIIKN
ncbi:T9SS type A sorting domain-containing protein [Flavobacterium sp.]|uniref:T9SS type A sorting domain-containing protein n=1 Tax=Flavobacterium sp. TaxID=239 RepID=UPI003752BA98